MAQFPITTRVLVVPKEIPAMPGIERICEIKVSLNYVSGNLPCPSEKLGAPGIGVAPYLAESSKAAPYFSTAERIIHPPE